MVCLPCGQLTHAHGKPDSQSCLEFPLEKFRPKFHPSPVQTLALFHGMLLVARINLSASPTLHHLGKAPLENITNTFPPPDSSHRRSKNCWLPFGAKGNQRVPRMSWSVCCPPLSLGPSERVPWSLSMSHGAFSADPAGRLSEQREGAGRCGSCSWEQCHSSWTGL